MGPLHDNTPLTNILTIAAAAVIGVCAWFLLWRLVDLLPAKLRQRMERYGDTLRAVAITQQQFAMQFGESHSAAIDLGGLGRARRGSSPPAWVGYLCLVIALVTGITAVLWFVNTLTFVSSAVSASGKVVELERTKCGSKGGICYAPRVLFNEDVSGRPVEFVSSASSNPPIFHMDEQVTVLYSPGRPERAMIQGLFPIWGGVISLFVFSIVFTIVGACILLFPDAVTSGSSGDPSSAGSGDPSSAGSGGPSGAG
jgi:Protein of unknown function (DUF3592)